MAVNDMMNDGFDADAARYDRLNRTQQADFAPGQDAVFQSQDIFAQSSVENNPNQMNDIFSSGVGGGMGMNVSSNPFDSGLNGIPNGNTLQPQQTQNTSQEDAFFNALKTGALGVFNVLKEIGESFSSLTPRWYSEWGRYVTITGLVVTFVGLVLKIFGYSNGLKISIGGMVSVAGGVLIWFLLTDSAKNYTSKYKDDNNNTQNTIQVDDNINNNDINSFNDTMGFNAGFGEGGFDNDFDNENFSDNLSTESDDDLDMYDIEEDYEDYYDSETQAEAEEGMNPEDAINSLEEVPRGMYERNYLWGMFTKVLPTMKPDFAVMQEIDENEDSFLYWDDKLREAGAVAGCKEDYLPTLLKLQENLFTVVVTCDRPQGFKPESVANELANIYAYSGGSKNENVFAKVDTVGAECIITIFNGASAMISLKDMMLQEKEFILDTKNYMPVIFGVDQLGRVIKEDLKKLESIIITGMPRSGKSWLVQAILTQMCAFVSPIELNIYIGDPKEGISDFKAFTLPHVKKFESEDGKIVNMLRNLVKVEGPRRKKIIGDAGFVNIWDFKERYPDIKIPIIYVVVDEIVTLASRMDKETNNEFRMLLRELISQLPALGIRAFLIPHVLNNDIIEKKTSDLVPCKISVKGNAEHIEKATGAKPKDFPYKLVNSGDMAVKLASVPNVMYVHSPALTDSNPKNNAVFDYLRRVWSKLEPDEVVDSVSSQAELDAVNNEALSNLSDMSEDIEVWTNSNENGLSGMTNDDLDLF